MDQSGQLTVTSAEFARQFGSLRQLPVDKIVVTHHGKETHILLTKRRFQDMIERATGATARDRDLPALADFTGWIQQGFVALAPDCSVLLANSVAHAMFEQVEGSLVGRNFFEAIPHLKGSLAESYIRRAMDGGERCSADLPSIARPGTWSQLEVVPTAQSTIVLLRDITQDVRRNRLADTKKALVEAMNLHGNIGYIRVGARGQIESAEPTVCKMLMLSEERLREVAIADLVPIRQRVAFRSTLEKVLRGQGPSAFETEFMVNDGTIIGMCGAAAELRGAYGSEGAVVIVTRRP